MSKKAHWEQIYRDKSPLEVSWYQSEPRLSLELITNTELPTDAAIIDIGGGTSTLIDHLIQQGYRNLAVLDISNNALTHARSRLGKKADAIEWYESDITKFTPPHPFDLWHDRAVFHFLTEATDRRNYIKSLNQSLKSGGHLIIATFAIGGPTKCSGLDIVQYDGDKLLNELGGGFELVEERTETHRTPTNVDQKFIFFRLHKT
jgi:SAM-dependent methyltransferase